MLDHIEETKKKKYVEIKNWTKTVTEEFIKFLKSYAPKHKDTVFIIDSYWIMFTMEPSDFTDCVVQIGGESALQNGFLRLFETDKDLFDSNNKAPINPEKYMKKWRQFYLSK